MLTINHKTIKPNLSYLQIFLQLIMALIKIITINLHNSLVIKSVISQLIHSNNNNNNNCFTFNKNNNSNFQKGAVQINQCVLALQLNLCLIALQLNQLLPVLKLSQLLIVL